MPGWCRTTPARGGRLQVAQNVVQQAQDPGERSAAVEEPCHGAQQVAEKVAGSRLGADVEHDPIEVHHEPEKVEIERPELEVEDLARRVGRVAEDRDGYRAQDVREDVPG